MNGGQDVHISHVQSLFRLHLVIVIAEVRRIQKAQVVPVSHVISTLSRTACLALLPNILMFVAFIIIIN